MNAESSIEGVSDQQERRARAGVYGLLSGVLLREFDRETLETLKSNDWAETLDGLNISVPTVDEDQLEELAIDYCRIFVGPKEFCPPCQSVWESGQFQSQVIDSMNEYLDVVDVGSSTSIKDHAGLQFEMMAIILQHEAEYPADAIGISESFFRRHIAWSERMLARAIDFCQTDFYRSWLQAAVEFVQSESKRFQ